MEIVRGMFLKGAGSPCCGRRCLALAVYGVAGDVLSAARFHKRLD